MENAHDLLARGKARRRLRSEPSFARYVRERAGLTQAEMAELVGADRSAVSRWEHGLRSPRPEALARYAELLGTLEKREQ